MTAVNRALLKRRGPGPKRLESAVPVPFWDEVDSVDKLSLLFLIGFKDYLDLDSVEVNVYSKHEHGCENSCIELL